MRIISTRFINISKLTKPIAFVLMVGLFIGVKAEAGYTAQIPAENEDALAAASMNHAATHVLAPVYPYLAQYIVEICSLQHKRGIGIDLGGGAGDLVTQLAPYTPGLYWINADINPWYLSYVSHKTLKYHCQGQVGFIKADATNLPFKDNFADAIVSRASFHFWPDMEKGFSEIKRVLKPGGKVFLGRGMPPNMPVDTARAIRKQQNNRITGYNPRHFANTFKNIMNNLNINDYKIIIPKPDTDVKYGIWIYFSY